MDPFHNNAWFHGGVGYQVYLRSFYDGNGDGIGDLKGLTHKLDYLQELGISSIWLSPFNPSPMADFGYDVADYYDVEPLFGKLEDVKTLIAEAHTRNIKILMDFVVNHTSIEHAWFKESRSSRDNPRRDWYTWRDAKPDGSPPNNWQGNFGGSVWDWDETTQQYYLHSFLKDQPDLNWDNPAVRQAMKDAMAFWLDIGFDGFRLDAVSWMSKDEQLRDNPPNPNYREGIDDPYNQVIIQYSWEGPKLFDYLNEITELVAKYPNKFIITEAYPDNRHDVPAYMQFYRNMKHGVSAPFNFEPIMMTWQASEFKKFIDAFQTQLQPEDVPIYTLGNLDRIRVATRIGRDAARAAAVMMLTLPGLPFIYYGEELGMENVEIPPDRVQDPFEKNVPGMGFGRDPGRTPMQWSAEAYAGFSTMETWLPLSPNYPTENVAVQSKDPDSFLSLYRRLITLRNESNVLKYGSYVPVATGNDQVFGYGRQYQDEQHMVLINYTDVSQRINGLLGRATQLLSSCSSDTIHEIELGDLQLEPNEAKLIKLL